MKSRPAQESLAPSFLSTVRWNIRGVQRGQKNHWRLSRRSVGATTDRVIAEGGGRGGARKTEKKGGTWGGEDRPQDGEMTNRDNASVTEENPCEDKARRYSHL